MAAAKKQREPRSREHRTFNTMMTVVCMVSVLGGLGYLFVVPGFLIRTEANVDGGLVITEIDGREVAIVTYRDQGASPLDRLFDDAGGARITAIDLQTGEAVWDERINDDFTRDLQLIGAGSKYVFLETTFSTHVISLATGESIATQEDIPGLEASPDFGTVTVYREDTGEILFGLADKALQVLDMDTLQLRIADSQTAATWSCVLDWKRYTYPRGELGVTGASFGTTGNLEADVGGETFGFDGGTLVRGGDATETVGDTHFLDPYFLEEMVPAVPATGACADATREADVFPDGTIATRTVEADGRIIVGHKSATDSVFSVVDTTSGEALSTSSPIVMTTDAAVSPSGRIAVVAQRDLTGVAPAVQGRTKSFVVYTVDVDGTMRELVLAPHGWFGLPW